MGILVQHYICIWKDRACVFHLRFTQPSQQNLRTWYLYIIIYIDWCLHVYTMINIWPYRKVHYPFAQIPICCSIFTWNIHAWLVPVCNKKRNPSSNKLVLNICQWDESNNNNNNDREENHFKQDYERVRSQQLFREWSTNRIGNK